jgi:hypothetical protein
MWEESHSFISGLDHHYPDSLIVDTNVSIEIDRNGIEPLTSERLLRMLLLRHIDSWIVYVMPSSPIVKLKQVLRPESHDKIPLDERWYIPLFSV